MGVSTWCARAFVWKDLSITFRADRERDPLFIKQGIMLEAKISIWESLLQVDSVLYHIVSSLCSLGLSAQINRILFFSLNFIFPPISLILALHWGPNEKTLHTFIFLFDVISYNISIKPDIALSVGAVEYSDCTSAEG